MLKEIINGNSVIHARFVFGECLPGISVRELSYGTATPYYSTPKLIRSTLYIHVVVSGSALINDVTVGPGDVFIMRPLTSNQIFVDGNEPFCQYWINTDGENVERMLNFTALRDHNVVRADMSHLFDILHDGVFGQCHDELLPIKTAGILQLVLASLPLAEDHASSDIPTTDYVNHAVDFLRLHYTSGITLSDVAGAVGITEKYLYKLFLRKMNTTPSQYLNRLRLNRAEVLLTSTTFSIAEIAYACGYKDAGYFSRYFRKIKNCSPTEFRKRRKRTNHV